MLADTRWVRRTLTALGLLALAACGGGQATDLTRAAGTTSTSTTTVTRSTSTTVAPAPAPSTTRRTTTTRSTIPGPVVITYQVEVHTADAATLDVASVVKATLDDPRGWRRAGFDFQLVDRDAPYTILIAEGAEVQQRCRPYDTYGKYSCQLGPLVAIPFASDAVGRDVLGQATIVHEMAHLHAAYEGGEVGDEAAVAAPPQTLGAHHRGRVFAGFGDHAVQGSGELRRAHVVGVGAE